MISLPKLVRSLYTLLAAPWTGCAADHDLAKVVYQQYDYVLFVQDAQRQEWIKKLRRIVSIASPEFRSKIDDLFKEAGE